MTTRTAPVTAPPSASRVPPPPATVAARGRSQFDFFGAPAAPPREPLVVSYGRGVDSTAILVEFARRGIRPDLILFADVGWEKQATYRWGAVMDAFLADVGFPPVTVVRYAPGHGGYASLEEDCLVKGMLPSLAYGRKACSRKWKIDPQWDYLTAWAMAREAWLAGVKIRHVIGYDAGAKDARRATNLPAESDYERFEYPLREWGWDRERCVAEIAADPRIRRIADALGLPPVPPKSACIGCPATQPAELTALVAEEPAAVARALEIEWRAAPRLQTVGGLWRKATKARPASFTEYLTGEVLVVGEAARQARAAGAAGGAPPVAPWRRLPVLAEALAGVFVPEEWPVNARGVHVPPTACDGFCGFDDDEAGDAGALFGRGAAEQTDGDEDDHGGEALRAA